MINEQTFFLSLAFGLLVCYLIFPSPDIIFKYNEKDESAGAGGNCLDCKCRASEEEVSCGDL